MAGVCPLDTSFTQDSEEVEFQTPIFKIIKTSKKKDSILHDWFYYNHMRDNKNKTTVLKCRHIVEVGGKKKNVLGVLLYQVTE